MSSANNPENRVRQILCEKQAAKNKLNDAQYELEKAEEAKSKGHKPSQ